jgi:hypothetical protein
MSGNIIPLWSHLTFEQKISNFPDNIYNFDEGDYLTSLMKILLGNSGTGQLRNTQNSARITQNYAEFSNLDEIMGNILNIKRVSSEMYSFATNPFIDQLTTTQWDEVIRKDSSYRERLMGAAESFQLGATIWALMELCEALTEIKFYVLEGWRNPGNGRSGLDGNREIVLYPILDTGNYFKWNQGKANRILSVIHKIVPADMVVSFGNSKVKMQTITISGVTVNTNYVTQPIVYPEYFNLNLQVSAPSITTPTYIPPGASTRYWLTEGLNTNAPIFAHLQTQEASIDLTGSISSVISTDQVGYPYNSVALPIIEVTSTVYGAQ